MIFQALVLVVAWVLYRFIFKVKYQIKFYTDQDPNIIGKFVPLTGIQKYLQQFKCSHNDTHAFLKQLIKDHPSTRAVVSNMGSKPFVLLTDLDLIKQFFIENIRNYQKLKCWKFIDHTFGNGVFFVEKAHWKAQRKVLGIAFNYDTLKSFVPSIKATTARYMDEFRQEIKEHGFYELQCLKKSEELIADILLKTYFSLDMKDSNIEGNSIALALIDVMGGLFQLSKGAINMITTDLFGVMAANTALTKHERILKAKLDRISEFGRQEIRDRLTGKVVKEDFLQYYVTEMKNTQQLKLKDPSVIEITEDEIFSQFLTFFFAGMDTTGHLIGLALYEITMNPQILCRLKQEFQEHIPTEEDYNHDNLKKCVYMSAVLNETLRFYPPAVITFFREATQDHQIRDIKIKKGTVIGASIVTMCHHPLYYKDPHLYNPDRWLTDFIEPYAFTPFGSGQRNCIGQHLAMLEARIILYNYLTKFKLEINQKTKFIMHTTLLYEPVDDNLIILK